jgi:hypothetical protein
VAGAFWKQIEVLNRSPEFLEFVGEVPGLAVEILRAGGVEGEIGDGEIEGDGVGLDAGLEGEIGVDGYDGRGGEGGAMVGG